MRRSFVAIITGLIGIPLFALIGSTYQAQTGGPYKVLQRAKVGGTGANEKEPSD